MGGRPTHQLGGGVSQCSAGAGVTLWFQRTDFESYIFAEIFFKTLYFTQCYSLATMTRKRQYGIRFAQTFKCNAYQQQRFFFDIDNAAMIGNPAIGRPAYVDQ